MKKKSYFIFFITIPLLGTINTLAAMLPTQDNETVENKHTDEASTLSSFIKAPDDHPTAPIHQATSTTPEDHSAMPYNTVDTTTDLEKNKRNSTAHHNDTLSLIKITAGQSHVLPVIINTEPQISGYFIQQQAYKSYLSFTQSTTGNTTTITYTITIPTDAQNGNFVIFKGQDSLTQPKNLEPAFRVEILALDHTSPALHQISTHEQIKKAWQQQQAAEQKYFNDAKERFEAFTKEVRTIWSAVKQDDTTTMLSNNVITKEPLHLTVGQTTQLASSQGGSIQSMHPEVVTAKLILEKSAEPVWNFFITGNKVGKSIILYSIDGTNYAQTVIVQEELLPTKQETQNLQITETPEESTTTAPQLPSPSAQITMHNEEKTPVVTTEKMTLPEPLESQEVAASSSETVATTPPDFFKENTDDDDDDSEEEDDLALAPDVLEMNHAQPHTFNEENDAHQDNNDNNDNSDNK